MFKFSNLYLDKLKKIKYIIDERLEFKPLKRNKQYEANFNYENSKALTFLQKKDPGFRNLIKMNGF